MIDERTYLCRPGTGRRRVPLLPAAYPAPRRAGRQCSCAVRSPADFPTPQSPDFRAFAPEQSLRNRVQPAFQFMQYDTYLNRSVTQ